MIVNTCSDYYKAMRYDTNESICLYYTYQCNIRCDHCSYNCGPNRTEKMSMEDAKRVLKGAVSSGKRVVELMGGELFLNYEELSELIDYSSSLELEVTVNTNGFWGKNFEDAKAMLSDLSVCGLKSIILSVDTFHQKFIPLGYPLNIIQAAHDLGISVWCNFCFSADLEKDRNFLNKLKKKIDHILIINPVPYGRSADLNRFSDIERCSLLCINILVNGDTFACPGQSDENKDIIDTPLYMGNCIQEPPNEVLGRKNLLCLEAFFNPGSPIWFKNFLQQTPYKQLFENKRFTHICQLCRYMMHNDEISHKIMEFGKDEGYDSQQE